MSDTTNYKCPACTGPLHFVGASGLLECDFCGSKYPVEQMQNLSDKVNDDVKKSENKDEKSGNGAPEEFSGEGYKALTCSSCGAELFCDETTVATSCPYCGNPTIIPSKFTGARVPDLIIPFKMDKKAAVEALSKFYHGKKLLPKTFKDHNHIEEIKGVYVPFWLFSGKSKFDGKFNTYDESSYTSGDEKVTIKKYYEESRTGEISFKNIPVDASKKMDNAQMDSVEPYDYDELKPYSSSYLPGFLAESYDDSEEDCQERAELRIKETASESAEDDISRDSVDVSSFICRISEKDVKYAFLPVWLLSTKWNDQNFLFAMNGQTGKVAGVLPIDKVKKNAIKITWFIVFELILNAAFYFLF